MVFAQIYMNVVYRLILVRFGGFYLMRAVQETLKLATISKENVIYFPIY
jgi:hypothetical protein